MDEVTDQQSDPTAKTAVETVVERAVDAFVYAPIGLLFDGASLLPQLVEKGRNQVTVARMLGRFAVEQGRGEATKAAGKIQGQAAGVIEHLAGIATHAPTPGPAPSPSQPPARTETTRPLRRPTPGAARAAARQVAGVTGPRPPATEPEASTNGARPSRSGPRPAGSPPERAKTTSAPKATSKVAKAPAAASLAIPDYDGLSASHVVNRLAGLSEAELDAVRRYEAANRGRKTILSKVAQLQSI